MIQRRCTTARPIAQAALLALIAFGTAAAQTPASINAVRFWTLGNVTRIAVEASGEVKWRTERLDAPPRLVIDLSEAKMKLGDKGVQFIRIDDAQAQRVRVAQRDPSTVRVVVDLAGETEYEISTLTAPFRVIVELRAKGSKGRETVVSQSRTGAESLDKPVETARVAEQVKAPPEPPVQPPPAPVEVAKAKPAPDLPKPEPSKAEQPKADPPKAEPVSTNPPPAARAAKAKSDGNRSLTRALGLKLGRVVIDAGHGGHDHGTTGPTGLTEKDLVLDVANRLGAMIEQRMGSEVIYTRSDDTFLQLEERPAIANREKADLFISIHANSSPLRSASGAEVYYLNFTNSRDALEVAARENAANGKSIFELKDLLQKIALSEKLDESKEFAGSVQTSLYATWSKINGKTRNRGVKKAPFVVLIGASMPSVLAEIGFVSNPHDEALLKRPDQRQRIAEALYKGLSQYASTLSRFEVASREKTAVAR